MDSMVEKITEDHESPEIQPEENQTNKPRENPLKKIKETPLRLRVLILKCYTPSRLNKESVEL